MTVGKMLFTCGLVTPGVLHLTPETHTQEGSPEKGPTHLPGKGRLDGCAGLDAISSFEETFLKKSFFLGENKLDRVLLSLLHLRDVSSMVTWKNQTFLFQEERLIRKIKQTKKSLWFRYKKEKEFSGFNPIEFAFRNSIPLDTINGMFPLVLKNPRILFHSLKLSYALYLTLKMFKLSNLRTNQRTRGGKIKLKLDNLLSQIFLTIFSQLKRLELSEKAMIKCIKNSLCTLVSKSMDQSELPQGTMIDLFPTEIQKSLRTHLRKEEYVRFCFSCLQSKVLCEEVPEDFILDTLIKHRDQLSSDHRGLTPKTIQLLKERGREFGKLVKKFYKPNKGFFPTNKATCRFPRNMGGVKGDLVFNQRLKDYSNRTNPEDRMEPFVIGLFGQPGQGKSTRINEIVSELSSLFPGHKYEELTYERTCHVDHWDGYCGQPITIFDDLGQTTDGKDIQEFQTLVSTCPYVLPMADLSEKGMKFSSPIIICTSNLPYGANLKTIYQTKVPIIDDASFWRRFSVPLHVEDRQLYSLRDPPCWVRQENLLMNRKKPFNPGRRQTLSMFDYFQRKLDFDQCDQQQKWQPCTCLRFLRSQFKEREEYHENFRRNWNQTVVNDCQDTSVLDPLLKDLETFGFTEGFEYSSGTGVRKSLEFSAFPPTEPLPVRVEPIVEPLKVRTITAGIGDTFCLKPLQRAMWLALGEEEQFCLTHGTNRLESAIKRIHDNSEDGDFWLSGDYTAATDSFAIPGSKAIMEGILESIDHEPTKRWAMKELSPHVLIYPKKTGIKPVLQKSGQLMGSLLSFPLLCLLNDCTARFAGISKDKYLINGDDILMRTQPTKYPIWKEVVREFGLDLSPGKNYVHARFGTVNSQLIVDGDVVGSGKQMILDRRARVLGECLRDLELNMPETPSKEVQDLFKSVNRSKLSKTVRDIHVPVSHGGLAFSWGISSDNMSKQSLKTAKLCYLNDLFTKIEPKKGCISIPYLSIEEKNVSNIREEEATFNAMETSREYHEDFLSPIDLQLVTKRCMSNSHLREILLDQKLENLPSLSFLKTYSIECSDVRVRKSLQKEIDSIFLMNFLQGGQNFGYETFRREFLLKTMNLKENNQSTVQHLVGLMDLNVSPDYLKYLNLNFTSETFSQTTFEKSLGTALKPKNFELPRFEDFEDYSKEVIKNFKEEGDEEFTRLFDAFVEETEFKLERRTELDETEVRVRDLIEEVELEIFLEQNSDSFGSTEGF